MRKFRVLSLVAIAALGFACAQPPQAELDAATAQLTTAEQAQAATYAPEQWAKAQQAMTDARAEMEAQKAKFALTRSYAHSKELLTAASTAAGEAKTAADAGKEAAKQAAQTALDAVKAGVDQAGQLITALQACPKKPKGFDADIAALQGNLDGLKGQVAPIETAIGSEDFAGAKTQAEALKTQVDTLVTDLGNAKIKISCP